MTIIITFVYHRNESAAMCAGAKSEAEWDGQITGVIVESAYDSGARETVQPSSWLLSRGNYEAYYAVLIKDGYQGSYWCRAK